MNMIKELFLILKYIFRRVLDDFIHFFLIHVFFFLKDTFMYIIYIKYAYYLLGMSINLKQK